MVCCLNMAKNSFFKKTTQSIISILIIFFSDQTFAEHFSVKEYRDFSQIQPRKKASLGNHKITVAVAATPQARALGLMRIQKLPTDEGMLFEFEDSQILSFWMKNTVIDLSIGFFNENKVLINSLEMKAVPKSLESDSEYPIYKSLKPAKYALEMDKGWFTSHKIKPGALLK